MVSGVAGQLQPEICLHGGTNVRRSTGIDTPAAVFVLLLQNVIRGLAEALRIPRAQQCVQQNVIRFQRSVGLQFAAPVAFFVLLGKQVLACAINRGSHTAGKIVNSAKTQLGPGRCQRAKRGGFVHN
jgi:hypothetical protein